MRITIKDSSSLHRAINTLKNLNTEKKWSVEVKEYRRDRSGAQNRLYFSWIKIIGDDIGYTKEEMHATFGAEFLNSREITTSNGEKRVVVDSTTSLNTKEFTEYLTKIELWAADSNIQLPHPDDYDEAMGVKR